MRPTTVAGAVAAVTLVGLTLLRALAPGREAVCPADAFECWDVLGETSRMMRWPVGLALVGALGARLRPPWTQALAVVLVACGAFLLFAYTLLGSSPTTPCQAAPCVPSELITLSSGAVWGFALGAILGEAWPRVGAWRAPIAGVVLGVGVVLLALLLAGWP